MCIFLRYFFITSSSFNCFRSILIKGLKGHAIRLSSPLVDALLVNSPRITRYSKDWNFHAACQHMSPTYATNHRCRV